GGPGSNPYQLHGHSQRQAARVLSGKNEAAELRYHAVRVHRCSPCVPIVRRARAKSHFRIALTIDQADTAIANGKITSDTPGPGEGKHTLKFSQTARMSTYLVAMAVGDFT